MKEAEINDHVPNPITVSGHLLSSLLEEISHAQAFKGKWSLVRTKLTTLQTQLADFSELPTSASNPLSLDFLNSISRTLTDAVSLATKCRSVTLLSEGKLKTQSDVDSVLARLDKHVRDSEILLKSGVLQDDAVVLSLCSSSSTPNTHVSKREAVRAESRNLITRLQIGNPESKNSAIDSLLTLLQEDDKNVMIAVALGIVPVLVRSLDSPEPTKEKVVSAISRVATVETGKQVLVSEGLFLLNHLLRVLESGSGFAREKACIALQALSFSKENARAIGSRGGIASLLEICHSGTPGSQAYAAGVLRNVAGFSDVRENLVEENAVYVLVRLVGSGTVLAQENAIGCLCNLVKDDESLKVLVVKEGGVECLRNFWDSGPLVKSLEVAIELLSHLATRQAIAEMIVSDGWVERILGVLSCGVLGVRIAAARAVYELGFHCAKTRKEMGESGCIAQLVKMLDGKAVEEREAAAKALSIMVLCTGNRRLLRKDERGVVSMVHLLDPSVQGLDKVYPVLVLSSLLHSKKYRKEMVAAGACVHLKKLVEMDVEGTKKLLDGLGKGKIWGVFSRP